MSEQKPNNVRRSLQESRQRDGRPDWDPPFIDYEDLIVEEDYKKRREALLKYYSVDVVKVTKYLDIDNEFYLLDMYRCWATEEEFNALKPLMRDEAKKDFFKMVRKEIRVDEDEAQAELRSLGIALRRQTNGSYVVYGRPSAAKAMSEPDTTIPTSPDQPKEAATTSPPTAVSPPITGSGGSELEDCPPPPSDTSPITTQPPPQPSPSANETTSLLAQSSNGASSDRDMFTSVIICGCRCI